MKVLKQTKQSITIEITPVELDLLNTALLKESSKRRRQWKKCTPTTPEELIYHMSMSDIVTSMSEDLESVMRSYRKGGRFG